MSDGVTLRDAEPRDRDLLLRLYDSTRQLELASVPWTPEQKSAFVEQQFGAQDLHYPAADGGPVGAVEVQGQ